ncbi:MAG: hypothetical protein WCO35_02890 [Candidatus Nomurabacteria bacterium]
MKNNFLKIFLLILPVIVFIFSSSAKADTFNLTYNDPSLLPSGCYQAGGYNSSGTSCNDTVVLVLTVNLNSGGYSNAPINYASNNTIFPYADISYMLCSGQYGGNCSDPAGSYNGQDSLSIANYGTGGSGIIGTGQIDGDKFYTCGNPTSINIGYGSTLKLSDFSGPCTFGNITQTQTYDLVWTFSVGLSTHSTSLGQYFWFPNLVAHAQVFIPKIVKPANKAPNILVK